MRRLLPLFALGLVIGCNESKSSASKSPAHADEAQQAKRDGAGAGPGGVDKPAKAPAEPQVARKIIYTGTIDIIVTDFDRATQQVSTLAEENHGYVANSKLEASVGDRRKATWTLRVPVANFRAVMDAAGQLGHVTNTHTDSQDVTDEYFDVEARLKTRQEEEKSLRELLTKSTDKLENLLAIRRELARVREDIESAQGRLNKLSKLTELTTITITLQERKDYVPPTAPTFGKRAGNTFSDSWSELVSFLQAVALAIVALVPWLPLILIGIVVPAFILRWLIRWSNRHAIRARTVTVVEVDPPDEPQMPA